MRVCNLALAALLAGLCLLWVAGDGGWWRWQEQRAELHRLAERNAALAGRNRALEASLADLRSGTEEIEEQARQRLGLIREDEEFFQLIDPAGTAADAP